MMQSFLTAEWKYLVMANYEVDPKLLSEYLPSGVELDLFEGKTYLSIVSFLFDNTKVLSIPIPFHTQFEEVNLRFYVKHKMNGEWRRGVVFIKEIVPKYAVSGLANFLFSENYCVFPMSHSIQNGKDKVQVEYSWKANNKINRIRAEAKATKYPIESGSLEEFITEHYWGYTKVSENKTLQYEVQHPRWEVFRIDNFEIDVDVAFLYGDKLAPYLKTPANVLMAEGSEIAVKYCKKLGAC